MNSFCGKKNQNDPISTEGGVAFQINLEFQVEIWNSGFNCYRVALYV